MPPTLLCGLAASLTAVIIPEKAVFNTEAKLHVGNLSKSTTQEELHTLFAQAGDVIAAELIKERKSGESQGFAFLTMSEHSEAEKAISMFNTYSLTDLALKVSLAKPREQRDGQSQISGQ